MAVDYPESSDLLTWMISLPFGSEPFQAGIALNGLVPKNPRINVGGDDAYASQLFLGILSEASRDKNLTSCDAKHQMSQS